jgi:ATP-dependent exoDNAse (exonuclease V) alpha subunit
VSSSAVRPVFVGMVSLFTVEGFAPTSRAAYQLEEAGVPSTTLQHHLALEEHAGAGGKHLYLVDESSLASTQQVHDLFQRLKENDRVVLVGDVRQHQAVDAGRPYEQLQHAGMQTRASMKSCGRNIRY